nr:hydroxyphenylacetyl-CoA thioesterase PaaI [Mycolicibacterium hippocampi]
MLANDRASAHLGVRLISCGPGAATVGMTITEFMTNGYDITHGGFVFALADTAFALACNGHGETAVAAAARIDFLVPTKLGDELTAEAVERVRCGRSGIYDVTVRRGDDIVAEFRGNSRQLSRTGG